MRPTDRRLDQKRFLLLAPVLAVALLCGAMRAQTGSSATASSPESDPQAVRFAVAHQHAMGGWCFGYLYVSPDAISYVVSTPAKDSSHSFQFKRSQLTSVSRWIFFQKPTKAVELRFGKSAYHFWWMPDEKVLQTGRKYEWDPPDAANPKQMIATIRDPNAVATADATDATQAQAPPGPGGPAGMGAPNPPTQGYSPAPVNDPGSSNVPGSGLIPTSQPPAAAADLDAWAPDGQVGDLQFNVPTGWKQTQVRDGIALVPEGLAPNAVVVIGFLPAQTVADPYAWFRATWANWKTQINLIDSGEPEKKHSANGFDVLRSYSRAYSQRLGNGVFILGAAVAGNRVAPYFYLCNTKCGFDAYETGFQSFELGLTLASLGTSTPNPSGGGVSAGLKGLYTSFKVTEGSEALGTFRVSGGLAYLVFFPDGNLIRYLPKEGLENFVFRTAVRTSRAGCGRYRMDGNQITIAWGDGSTYSGVRNGTKLQVHDQVSHAFSGSFDSMGYQPVANSNGLTLGAMYHPDRTDPRARINFAPDGNFAESGALQAIDIPSSAGTGSYHIQDNTLTLSYSDGRVVRVSFFISTDEQKSQQPSMIYLNGRALVKVSN